MGGFMDDIEDIEDTLKELQGDSDALTDAIREMGKELPGLARTLLDERDEWMAEMVYRARRSPPPVIAYEYESLS